MRGACVDAWRPRDCPISCAVTERPVQSRSCNRERLSFEKLAESPACATQAAGKAAVSFLPSVRRAMAPTARDRSTMYRTAEPSGGWRWTTRQVDDGVGESGASHVRGANRGAESPPSRHGRSRRSGLALMLVVVAVALD